MDYIGIKRFDANGKVTGELRVVGLFTSTAYTRPVDEIPLLRAKAGKVIDRFGFDPQSHSGKMLINTLESYPRDELFQIGVQQLATFCEQINELTERPRVRVLPRIDHFDRFVSVMLFVPRDQYDSDVRERIGSYLASVFDGHVSAFYPAFPEGAVARVHFIIGRASGKTPRVSQETLENAVREIVTRWEDRFAAIRPADGPDLAVTEAYREQFSPEQAVADLPVMQACAESDSIRIEFYRPAGEAAHELSVKIFQPDRPVTLSRRVPLLENLGFNVISEHTFELDLTDADGRKRRVILHDMQLAHMDSLEIDLSTIRSNLEEAFLGIWHGAIDDDSFNRLIVSAGMTAREAALMRAYARYLRQTGITYSQNYIADTLNRYPHAASDLFRLFQNRFDIALGDKTRLARAAAITDDLEKTLADVPSLDDDRILRRYLNIVAASLRTNYFQTRRGRHAAVGARRQARSAAHRRPSGAAAVSRDLRLWRGGGGRSPALRSRCPRRPAMVRPGAGLPHRGAGPREGTAGQERRDRAGRRQGRLLPEETAGRRFARRRLRGRQGGLQDLRLHAAFRDRQHPRRRGRAAEEHRAPRRRRSLFRRRRRQGHGNLFRHRQRDQPGA